LAAAELRRATRIGESHAPMAAGLGSREQATRRRRRSTADGDLDGETPSTASRHSTWRAIEGAGAPRSIGQLAGGSPSFEVAAASRRSNHGRLSSS